MSYNMKIANGSVHEFGAHKSVKSQIDKLKFLNNFHKFLKTYDDLRKETKGTFDLTHKSP